VKPRKNSEEGGGGGGGFRNKQALELERKTARRMNERKKAEKKDRNKEKNSEATRNKSHRFAETIRLRSRINGACERRKEEFMPIYIPCIVVGRGSASLLSYASPSSAIAVVHRSWSGTVYEIKEAIAVVHRSWSGTVYEIKEAIAAGSSIRSRQRDKRVERRRRRGRKVRTQSKNVGRKMK
jgi:hypothetical protein